MKIFVLGAFGFIGNHLCAKLHQLAHDVITEMRYWSDRHDVIINLAAVTHTRNEFDAKMIESNIILMNEVFKRPERIIYASSCSAKYFTNPYAMTKMWAEYLGNKHGNSLGLRFHNVYGPGNNKGIVWFLENEPDGANINIRGPELVRDYIHVDDVVDSIVSHLDGIRFTGVVDIGTGLPTETMGLVNIYQRVSGKSFNITVREAGDNEPKEMVSNFAVPGAMDLQTGLLKTINYKSKSKLDEL